MYGLLKRRNKNTMPINISIKKQGKPDKKPGSIKAKKKCFIEGSRII